MSITPGISRRAVVMPDTLCDVTADPSTMTITVTLDNIDPPIWRRFTVRGDLTLPGLHEVIQDVMGWEDRHLHLFFFGDEPWRSTRRYEMQSSVDEYDDGTATVEDGVRVDELLVDVGDRLGYEYDFGDGWTHHLVLDSVTAADGPSSPVCLAGGRACPPEDCGGPRGYDELLGVLADPHHDDYEHMLVWAGDVDSERIDLGEANGRISSRREVSELVADVAATLPKLGALFERQPLRHQPALLDVLRRVDTAESDVDTLVAEQAMGKFTWALARLGSDGIKLTASGYLPPKDVAAMRNELDWGPMWIGNSTREIDCPQVHWLRQALTQLGLVRVFKGRLVATRVGIRLLDDPAGLWDHVAERLPVGREDYEKHAGLLLLTAVASGCSADERNSMMGDSMELIGWMIPDRERRSMQYVARPTLDVLALVGAVPMTWGYDGESADWGRLFAVHALAT